MKICLAQTRPFRGDINKNSLVHQQMTAMAIAKGASLIVFPELSLSGYEPALAGELAMAADDGRLLVFQQLSDAGAISICLGLPTLASGGLHISMVIFCPGQARQFYSKQLLHEDELPYFTGGQQSLMLHIDGTGISPAICYESLQESHAAQAFTNGAQIYMASVAKSARGLEKACVHYPKMARKYGMTVLMVNSVGPCDNFESAGGSAVWNSAGELAGKLNGKEEGLLIWDSATEKLL